MGTGKSNGEDLSSEAAKVTRRIMIIKPPSVGTDSPPASPAGSTPPVSPFSGKQFTVYFKLLQLVASMWDTREVNKVFSKSCANYCRGLLNKLLFHA